MRDSEDFKLTVEMCKKYASMTTEEICEMIRGWHFQKNIPITSSLEDEPKMLTREEFLECERLSNLPLFEKCNHYRNQTNYCLPPKSYGLIMVDGKNFSTRLNPLKN